MRRSEIPVKFLNNQRVAKIALAAIVVEVATLGCVWALLPKVRAEYSNFGAALPQAATLYQDFFCAPIAVAALLVGGAAGLAIRRHQTAILGTAAGIGLVILNLTAAVLFEPVWTIARTRGWL